MPAPGVRVGDLFEVLGHLLVFTLSFAVVANFWWQHRAIFRLLLCVDPGLVTINLVLLGAVALVPFPTELVGSSPTATAPVVVYLVLMLAIAGLHLLLVRRAEKREFWRLEVTPDIPRRLQAGWAGSISVILVGLLVSEWIPVAGPALLLLTGPADVVAGYLVRARDPLSPPPSAGPVADPAGGRA